MDSVTGNAAGDLHASQPRRIAHAWPAVCIFLLLAVGTLLRVSHYLNAPSFWFDEAALLLNIVGKTCLELAGPLDHQQSAPLFYLWTLRGLYVHFGCNEWSMRLPAVVGGIAMVWIMWRWAAHCLHWPGVIVAVGLAATSMHGLQHADEVKPYALDAMWTALILWTGIRGLVAPRSSKNLLFLVTLAMLAPWVSYPAVFSIAGVGIAWTISLASKPDWRFGTLWLAYGVGGLTSCALYWVLVARHQHTRELTTWWTTAFWDFSSPIAPLTWLVSFVVKSANYATTGMGIPFLLFGGLGAWSLARHSPRLFWMIAGLFATALLANALRKYPLDGRVSFFLAPVYWLLIGAAADFLCLHLSPRWKWLPVIAIFALGSADLARTCKASMQVRTNGDFRTAFERVHQHWRSGDLIWQSSPGVYQIYYGSNRLHATTETDWKSLPPGSSSRRLWLISPPEAVLDKGLTWSGLQDYVAAKNWRRSEQWHYAGVELLLFESAVESPVRDAKTSTVMPSAP